MSDIKPETPMPPVAYGQSALLRDVESFLAYDSELLDGWRLDEWFQLFTPDCRYLVPTTDRPAGDPREDLFFVRDDWFLLSERVRSIMNGTAWAESPRSVTHRMISNVRAVERDDAIEVKANLLVHRSAGGNTIAYPAHLTLHLVGGGHAGFEITFRQGVLAMQQLRPHGRLSILL